MTLSKLHLNQRLSVANNKTVLKTRFFANKLNKFNNQLWKEERSNIQPEYLLILVGDYQKFLVEVQLVKKRLAGMYLYIWPCM